MTSAHGHPPQPEEYASVSDYIRASDSYHDSREPSALQVIDRAVRLGSNALYAIDLQIRRIASSEPEDEEFLFRPWMDIQYLIYTFWRMRLAGRAAARKASDDPSLVAAVAAFDRQIPHLKAMRDVAQHLDDYILDSSQRRTTRRSGDSRPVGRRQLEVGAWSMDSFHWLGMELRFAESRQAAAELYSSLRAARARNLPAPEEPEAT